MKVISCKDIIQKVFLNYLPDVEARSRSEERLAPASIALPDELLDAASKFDTIREKFRTPCFKCLLAGGCAR